MYALGLLILPLLQDQWVLDREWQGPHEFAFMGIDASHVGDIDGDQLPDFLIGSRDLSCSVFSSGSGQEIYTLDSPDDSDGLGWSVLNMGDITGDAVDDYLVSSPMQGHPGPPNSGKVVAYNGKNGSVIRKCFSQSGQELFGYSLAKLPDLNNDNYPELAIGAPMAFNGEGRVYLYSGIDLSFMHSLNPSHGDGQFGRSICFAGDTNGDGSFEIAIGSPLANQKAGLVEIFDATSGLFISSLSGMHANGRLGYQVAGAEDLNQDGLDDLFISSPRASSSGLLGNGQVCAWAPNANSVLWEVWGSDEEERFGTSIAVIADINGDNSQECIVGAPYGRFNSGTITGIAKLFSGNNGIPIRKHLGAKVRDYFGNFVCELEDFDGDGINDYGVGAYESDAKGNAKYDGGSFYVFSSVDGSLLNQLDGHLAADRFGWSACSVGDQTGDGIPELLVGALYANTSLRNGNSGDEIRSHTGNNDGDDFGRFVFSAGDADNDGIVDLAVGAFSGDPSFKHGAGELHIYSGATGLPHSVLKGEVTGNFSGASFANLGDLDGDGFDDYAVGAPMASINGQQNSGQVRVVSGIDGQNIWVMNGVAANDRLGNCLETISDLNGDSVPDLIAGAYLDSQLLEKAGAIYVLSGIDGQILSKIDGQAIRDYFGYSIAALGDLNGDQYSEFAVGAKYADPQGMSEAGSVYIYSGSDFSQIVRLDGANEEYLFGNEIVGGSDFNLDGINDIVIAAKYADINGATNAGAIYVYSGANYSLLSWLSRGIENEEFGYALATGFDANQDGRPDLLVTSANADSANGTSSGRAEIYLSRLGFLMDTPNMIAGNLSQISVQGATPYGRVDFAASITGGGPTSTPFGAVHLTPPFQTVLGVTASATGSANFSTFIPANSQGKQLWMQAYDHSQGQLCPGISTIIQ